MNYEIFPVATKVETRDEYGYPVWQLCGTVEKNLGEGHAIIKSFQDGLHYSTVGSYGLNTAVTIEAIN